MSFKSWTRNNFVAGVLVLVPVLGTIALFSWLFAKVTGPGYEWVLRRFRSETTVQGVMIPETELYWLDENQTLDEVKEEVLRTGRSRFPVNSGKTGEFKGVLLREELLKYSAQGDLSNTTVQQAMVKDIPLVRENKNVSDLHEQLQLNMQEAAMILDERSKIVGMVVIEDLAQQAFAFRQILEENELLFRLIVLFLMIGLTVLIGLLVRNFLGRRIFRLGETLLERIPIVNRVYIALRQISRAFWGRNKTVFSHVVLLEYPRRGLYTLGFVTSPGRGEVDAKTEEKLINVFLPTTPNPTSGWFVMVPEDQAVTMEMKVEDALKMIISGGAVVPEYHRAIRVFEGRHGKKENEQQGQTKPESEIATPQPG